MNYCFAMIFQLAFQTLSQCDRLFKKKEVVCRIFFTEASRLSSRDTSASLTQVLIKALPPLRHNFYARCLDGIINLTSPAFLSLSSAASIVRARRRSSASMGERESGSDLHSGSLAHDPSRPCTERERARAQLNHAHLRDGILQYK